MEEIAIGSSPELRETFDMKGDIYGTQHYGRAYAGAH